MTETGGGAAADSELYQAPPAFVSVGVFLLGKGCPVCFACSSRGWAHRTQGEVDDVATLVNLNEETLLTELRARYEKDVIYVR